MPHRERPLPQPRCHRYDLTPEWTVFAGRTDADNDLLSTSFARPDDYWFHVHDVPGSHVLLRGDGEPDRELIMAAAAIAAWHSKARQASSCQVDCTRARFVSKPPRAPAGTVTISNSRTLKVRPALPGGLLP